MFTIRVNTDLLENRIDSSFYNPIGHNATLQLSQNLNVKSLKKVVNQSRKITNGVRGPAWDNTEYKLIRLQDCADWIVNVEGAASITKDQFYENRRCRLQANDIVVAIGGYVGNASVVLDDCMAVIGQHSAVLPLNGNDLIDSRYLLSYLNCKYAEAIFSRYVSGTVQAGINLEDLRELQSPTASLQAQTYIGNKVRQAERLRARARELREAALNSVALCTLGDQSISMVEELDASLGRIRKGILELPNLGDKAACEEVHIRVSADQIFDRIDSWYYKPEYALIDTQIKSLEKYHDLLSINLKSFADVQYGFMPLEDYWEESKGHPFLRVTNICDDLLLDLSSIKFVNPDSSNNKRYRLSQNDVLIVQCGNSTGRIALVPEDIVDWAFPSFSLRLKIKKRGWDSGYLAAFLSSPLGKQQIQRSVSITSVRPNTTKPAIENVLIPILQKGLQEKIGTMVRSSVRIGLDSVKLTTAAKLLVEALIEGQVAEADLIAAQKALEAEDRTADREILSRLTRKGMDVAGEPPLFPDLDGLYNALDALNTSENVP